MGQKKQQILEQVYSETLRHHNEYMILGQYTTAHQTEILPIERCVRRALENQSRKEVIHIVRRPYKH